MKRIYLITLLIVLIGCDAGKVHERKVKRAEKKIERLTIKYPELIQKDTIRDTVRGYVPMVSHDTAFIYKASDTVEIDTGRLFIRYITRNDSVFIEGECKADTIEIIHEVPCETVKVVKESDAEYFVKQVKKNMAWIVGISILLLIVYIAFRAFGKSIKPF